MRPVPAALQTLRDLAATTRDRDTVAELVAAERKHTASYKEAG